MSKGERFMYSCERLECECSIAVYIIDRTIHRRVSCRLEITIFVAVFWTKSSYIRTIKSMMAC